MPFFRLYGELGRFFGIDLLADMFADHSPYHFAYNNPISFVDPTGLHNVPARPTETIGKGGYLEMIDDYDGWALVIEITQPNLPIPDHVVEFIDHSGGYGGGTGSGHGGSTGGGGTGNGSGNNRNPSPGGADNGKFSDDNIDTIQDYISNYLTILEEFAKEAYKYGDDVMNAAEKTAENAARMNNIAKRAGIIGNVITAGDIVHGFVKDNGTIGQNTQQAIAGALGGMAGAYAGAKIFGTAGLFLFGPVGGFVGGIAGALIGGYYGGQLGESIVESYYQ